MLNKWIWILQAVETMKVIEINREVEKRATGRILRNSCTSGVVKETVRDQ